MKKLLLILFLCLIPTTVFSAELLVRAKSHWMDTLTQAEVDKMTLEQKQSYEARSQVGDIVVVRGDNWQWGKEECLPNYVVVKIPQITEVEAKQYEQSLMVQDGVDTQGIPIMKMLRHRKYALPRTDIQTITTNNITLNKNVFNSKLITKTGASSEVVQPNKNITLLYWRKIANKINPYLKTAYNFYVKKCYAAQFLYKTVKPSGGDYTSLEACMNANEQDLTGDGWFDVEIDGNWSGGADSSAVTNHNYTTTSSDYINIYTKTGTARHTGKPTATCYQNTAGITQGTNYTTLDGLYLNGNGITIPQYATIQYVTIKNNLIVKNTGAITAGSNGYSNILYIYNNVIKCNLSNYTTALYWNTDITVYAYNNTLDSGGTGSSRVGFYVSSNAVLKNNISVGGTNCYYGTPNAKSDYNLSSDATAPGTTNYRNKTITFIDSTNVDYHLDPGETDAIDMGTNLSTDPDGFLSFTTDIDGDTRGASWDIGADELTTTGKRRMFTVF